MIFVIVRTEKLLCIRKFYIDPERDVTVVLGVNCSNALYNLRQPS